MVALHQRQRLIRISGREPCQFLGFARTKVQDANLRAMRRRGNGTDAAGRLRTIGGAFNHHLRVGVVGFGEKGGDK